MPQIVKEMLDGERDNPGSNAETQIDGGAPAIASIRTTVRASSKVRFLLEGLEIQELKYAHTPFPPIIFDFDLHFLP